MTILLTAVGTTDPIRGGYDGPVLHIARVYQPEKIVLIYSEEMYKKHDSMVKALESINGYLPEIIVEEERIKNTDVHLFDAMYAKISELLKKYSVQEEDIILNLSSATPQIISAMFAVNRINEYHTRAVQVATPAGKSNQNIGYDSEKDIEMLINTNNDNQDNFTRRIIEDKGEKFNQSLLKRSIRTFICNYNYEAVYDLLKANLDLLPNEQSEKVLNELNGYVKVFKNQAILSQLKNLTDNKIDTKALSYYLTIDVLNKRGQIADVLIKAKSLTEYLIIKYINDHHSNLIKDKNGFKIRYNHKDIKDIENFINKERERKKHPIISIHNNLSIYDLCYILKFYNKENPLIPAVEVISDINKTRNEVAHGLSEINEDKVGKDRMEIVLAALRTMLETIYKFDKRYFNIYDEINKRLLKNFK